VKAFDGTYEVVLTNKPASTAGAWVTTALRMDYAAKTWSLWVNGTNIFSDFSFFDASRDTFSRVTLSVGTDTTTHVDNVKATFDGPGLILDDDGDEMDDFWEVFFFGSATNSSGGASEDWDLDGFLDLYEFLAGTDPTSAFSLLAISNAWQQSGTDLIISWYSVMNKSYAIGRSTNLFQPWSPLVSNISATPPLNVHTVTVENTPSYYQINLE
jgi:hypothetical protein